MVLVGGPLVPLVLEVALDAVLVEGVAVVIVAVVATVAVLVVIVE